MTNVIQQLEEEQLQSLNKNIPEFRAGDTVRVEVKVKEGTRERLQAFEGVVIAKRNRGLNSSFTVRKISHAEGVERVFQTFSTIIGSITVKRHGDVRRAKLYYLREREGRSARIKEKLKLKSPKKATTAAKKKAPVAKAVDTDTAVGESSEKE